MRTIVYIDGFNLYFGCLARSRQNRWLNVQALAELLCRDQDPRSTVVAVKYFTAPIKARLSVRSTDSVTSQNNYFRALEAACPLIEIIKGEYQIVPGRYHRNQNPINFDEKIEVLRPEEKKTDVNIAVHMLCDAMDNRCDQQVLISNDSDCAPAVETIHARWPEMILGVIAPLPPNAEDAIEKRRPSVDLSKPTTWARSVIRDEELARCQLPDKIPTRKKPILKPSHW